MTGNGSYGNLLKHFLEKLVKSHQVNLFLVGFSHIEPLCAALPPQGAHRAAAGLGKQAFYDDPPHYLEAVGP